MRESGTVKCCLSWSLKEASLGGEGKASHRHPSRLGCGGSDKQDERNRVWRGQDTWDPRPGGTSALLALVCCEFRLQPFKQRLVGMVR